MPLPLLAATKRVACLLTLVVLALIALPAQTCRVHGPKSLEKLAELGHFGNPRLMTPERLRAQENAFEHLEQHKAHIGKQSKSPRIRQVSDNSVSDSTWMRIAMAAAMECYGPCPAIPYGAVLIHRPSNQVVMHSCNTAYLDATQHAEMNTIQFAARYYLNHSEAWWSSLTLYTTAEPCPMCMAAARWTGVGEIVYGTSISTQSSYGWESIEVGAQQINSASTQLPTSTLLVGPFGTTITDPYFAWQFNSSAPCPIGCRRERSSNRCTFNLY